MYYVNAQLQTFNPTKNYNRKLRCISYKFLKHFFSYIINPKSLKGGEEGSNRPPTPRFFSLKFERLDQLPKAFAQLFLDNEYIHVLTLIKWRDHRKSRKLDFKKIFVELFSKHGKIIVNLHFLSSILHFYHIERYFLSISYNIAQF